MSYNVLIVDDSKSMRKVIKKILHLSGMRNGEFLEASNGQEALEVLESHWVDLILSDIHMPVMDGLGLLHALKENEMWKDLPVVFVTTEANEVRLKEVLALGARGYLRKPFRPEDIRPLLAKIMGENNELRVAGSDEGCDF